MVKWMCEKNCPPPDEEGKKHETTIAGTTSDNRPVLGRPTGVLGLVQDAM